ncbi:hypothetical protein TWF506_006280 [Arthrobotrys conoides]|uniref:Secreted protein n=1 Tax=Arthrobotrys conoides TaxID=74498 RepID=A0AAN8NGJ4_9PEZI
MRLITPLFLFIFSVSLTSAEIPNWKCLNPMPRTPPIAKSPFVTNTWNFLELISGTRQFLQMASTLRASTVTLYNILVKIEESPNTYIPYFPFSQAYDLYMHILKQKLHCWPHPKYVAFFLVQLRDINIQGRIETYEAKEPREPNPPRELPKTVREPPRIIREIPGPGMPRGTPRTSDRDTFRTSDRGTTGQMELVAGEGALPPNNNNADNQKINTNERQQGTPYRLFGNEATSGAMFETNPEGDSNQPNRRNMMGGLSAFNTASRQQTPQKPPPENQNNRFNPQPLIPGGNPDEDIWNNQNPGNNNQPPPFRNLFGDFADENAQGQDQTGFGWPNAGQAEANTGNPQFRAPETENPGVQFDTQPINRNIGGFGGGWANDFPRQDLPLGGRGNPIVVGGSIEEEEKEGDNQAGDMEIENQPYLNTRGRLQKRGDEDISGNVKNKKLPAMYEAPLRELQTNIEDFWSPIFDLLVSETYLEINQEQVRPAWQVGLPWREYGNTLKKVSTIMQVWQKDREVKQRLFTIEELEAKFGHLLQAMTLGRLVAPYQRRPEDEEPVGPDDEELTIEEPSYG